MNKSELIESLSKKTGVSKLDSEKTLYALIETIIDNVQKGNKVAIPGLGIFERVHRPARNGINPLTQKPLTIKAKNIPKFKISKAFKEKVA